VRSVARSSITWGLLRWKRRTEIFYQNDADATGDEISLGAQRGGSHHSLHLFYGWGAGSLETDRLCYEVFFSWPRVILLSCAVTAVDSGKKAVKILGTVCVLSISVA
jgi:hypothetical protein